MKQFLNNLVFLFLPLTIWAYDFQADNFNFDFVGNTNEVVLRSQIIPTETVVIPSTVTFRGKEFYVTEIGENAFSNSNLREVGFKEGLKSINNYAFQNTKIKKIVLPDSHTVIGEYAFADCPDLKYVEFGKGIRSAYWWRTLTYTFCNDDNIEKIVFRGNFPPLNFDYMPFSRMTRQFCKIYVPINGYYNFLNSPWNDVFANNIIPYSPKGMEVETVPYCMYSWDDNKVTNKYEIKGTRSSHNQYTGTNTFSITIVIEECPDEKGNVIVRFKYKGAISDRDEFQKDWYYTYLPKDSDLSSLKGESWRVINPDKEPSKDYLSIEFKKGKIQGLLKSKTVNQVELKLSKEDGSVKETGSFVINEIPNNLNVKFE